MDKACSMKLKRTGHLGDLDLNWRNNAEGDLKELGCKDVERIHLTHDRAQ
jgi:hypothetical protein